jgi:tripartite ATP-independent transporter DctM subunit
MDFFTIGLIGIAILVIVLLLGVHIGVALGFVGLLGSMVLTGIEPALWGAMNVFYSQVASYALITVPLFIAMGYLATAGNLSGNIFNSLNHWIGGMRGGVGIATVASCTLFGTICGSSIVTSSVFTIIAAPEMRKRGYDKSLAYGICASSGLIGMLIPPSILMVVYGILSGDSVGKLLIAGITPGVVLAVFYSITIYCLVRFRAKPVEDKPRETFSRREKLQGLRDLWPVAVVIIITFGGIFGGVFSPTEAGAITTFIVLVLLIVLEKKKSIAHIVAAFKETARTSAMIFLIFGGAAIFSQFLILSGIANRTVELIIALNLSTIGFLCLVALVYLVLGCFLDSISMLTITIPLLHPILGRMGIDPIYYAVVVIVAIEIGMITPPVGLCVYAAKAVAEADVSLEDIFRGTLPFFIVSMLALLIFILVPSLSTYLPGQMFRW